MMAVILVSAITALGVSIIWSKIYGRQLLKYMDMFFEKEEEFVKREIKTAYQKELLKSRWK